jgi:ankyrin repeat protein
MRAPFIEGWLVVFACLTGTVAAAARDDDLHAWVQTSDVAKVKAIIAKNPKLVNSKGRYNCTPLELAATQGRWEMVNLLLAAGAEVDIVSAAGLGDVARVTALLKEKPWLAKPPNKPLHSAAGHGHLAVVKILLAYGADPNLDYGFGNVWGPYTPLSDAVTGGHYEIAKALCESGAKVAVSGGKNYDSLFHYAVGYCDARFVRLMLEYEADVNAIEWGLTPLHVAAELGDLEKAKVLLEFRADINAQTSDGATPLFFAAVGSHRPFCDLLLARGARLDIHSACALGKRQMVAAMLKTDPTLAKTADKRLRRTPLFWAVRSGDAALVKLLLASGAEANVRAPHYYRVNNVISGPEIWHEPPERPEAGETPLHLAAEEGHAEVARMLIAKGADQNIKDESGQTPLYRACDKRHLGVVKLLLAKGAAVNIRDTSQYTPLHEAVADKAITEALLAAGADPNAVADGWSPLVWAAYHGHSDTAELLLAHGAKLDLATACLLGKVKEVERFVASDAKLVNAPQPWQWFGEPQIPLGLAARAGQTAIVKLLLAKGAVADPTKLKYPTPLNLAAIYGHVSVARLFLDKGIPVDARPAFPDGTWSEPSALFDACTFGQLEMVRFLLSRRASPHVAVYQRGTPLHNVGGEPTAYGPASKEDDPTRAGREMEIARLLLAAGADVNARSSWGETPLHALIGRDQPEIAALLVENGAAVNARDGQRHTPLYYALRREAKSHDPRIKTLVELLRKHGGVE